MDIYCDDCGAIFREHCHCGPVITDSKADDRWVGIDGHCYRGDESRPSLGWHDTERCACPAGENFDPESWY